MKRPVFIAGQSARPSGLIGRVIAGVMARETSDLNERAVRLLRPSSFDRVLEIGSGHGRTIERVASVVHSGCVCGVDVSESMLNMAVRRNRRAIAEGRVELRKGECASIPFDAAIFDGVLSVHTLYFWSDPAACLREIRRVLRPGARLVLGFLRRRQPPTKALSEGSLHIPRRTGR
jgi:ubiquinone/menaquinone biosynthesis C-methylase UbiE